ncbi:transposase [Streptomyces sp. MUSC 14]|uniref:transposase n=1 Tax=Streptomyces sp. MUSC 14 TaxID=1354889 RepID=UPI0008F5F5BB|nr:transposase [Streptomyces sp. MUSC 14]
MTAPDSSPLRVLAEDNLAAASPDLLRAIVKTFADALMSAEADALRNTENGQEVSDERVNHRNGYRPRRRDTRAGTVELAIPKLRYGSYLHRRLARDYETLSARSEAMIHLAMTNLRARRLTSENTISWHDPTPHPKQQFPG